MRQLLDSLKSLLPEATDRSAERAAVDEAQLASAALLIQMAAADFEPDSEELSAVEEILQRLLPAAERQEIDELVAQARRHAEDSVSLYDFTAVIQREWNEDRKTDLVRDLWHIAFVDGQLDPKEEFLVRKVAGLLHVPQERFIAAKREAREEFLRTHQGQTLEDDLGDES